MNPRAGLAVVLLVSCAAAGAQGRDTVYKIVGPDGKVTYSQEPPASGAAPAKKMEFEQLPASPLPAYVLKFRQEMERNIAGKQAEPPGSLQLYSAKWCGYCKLAKAWLVAKGIAYQELDIDTPAGMAPFVRTGGKSVPLLVGPGNVRVQGFTEAAYAAALKKP